MSTASTDLAAALRADAEHQPPHRRAALELLIWHESWLLRAAFLRACVIVEEADEDGPATTRINWGEAKAFAATNPRASTSELSVLRFAVALATDEYALTNLGDAHRRAFAAAMLDALDLQPGDLAAHTAGSEAGPDRQKLMEEVQRMYQDGATIPEIAAALGTRGLRRPSELVAVELLREAPIPMKPKD